MRIALGIMVQEANTFSPNPITRADFVHRQLAYGENIWPRTPDQATEDAGALSVLRAIPDCTLLPLLAANALSGGPIEGEVFQELLEDLLTRLRAVLPVDGVLLVLHGAMMAAGAPGIAPCPDATGEILSAVRAVVGPDVPVVGTLDLHANVTARMAAAATALVGYHTAPHVDLYDAGVAAARILVGTVRGVLHPMMALVRLPLLVPAENARHTDGPLSEVLALALAAEHRTGGNPPPLLHAGVFAVQPWMDTPDTGCAVLAVSDGDISLAQQDAHRIASAFWERRSAFVPELVPPDEAVRRALARERGMVVLCDSADAPSSGSTGDSTVILEALLRAGPPQEIALLNMVDPQAVAQAIVAGVGQQVTLEVGGKLAPGFWRPVAFQGTVRLISDGFFTHKGPGLHGRTYGMGRTVVLVNRGLHLVVMEYPVLQWDPQLYRSLGEEPGDARMVQVKSPAAFRAAYGPLADEILIVASPGPSSPQLGTLPWQRLRRPIYPLDQDVTWP